MAECTDETIECHRGDMIQHRAEFQTEPTVSSQQGITSHLRRYLAIAQHEVGEDREHCFAPRALDTPECDSPQADTDIMGVAGQAPAAATGRLVCKLKAQRQEKGQDE